MGQDQFDENDSTEEKKGLHFFTILYTVLNATTLFNVTALYYLEQQVGFNWGYGAVAGIFVVCFIVFVLGTPYYRQG